MQINIAVVNAVLLFCLLHVISSLTKQTQMQHDNNRLLITIKQILYAKNNFQHFLLCSEYSWTVALNKFSMAKHVAEAKTFLWPISEQDITAIYACISMYVCCTPRPNVPFL